MGKYQKRIVDRPKMYDRTIRLETDKQKQTNSTLTKVFTCFSTILSLMRVKRL